MRSVAHRWAWLVAVASGFGLFGGCGGAVRSDASAAERAGAGTDESDAAAASGGRPAAAAGGSVGGTGLGGTAAGTLGSAGAGGGEGSRAECPATVPTHGSACAIPYEVATIPSFRLLAHCSYGDDPRPSCRTRALCQDDGTWEVTPPGDASCSTSPLPPECPDPPPTPQAECDDDLACWYDDGTRCTCTFCPTRQVTLCIPPNIYDPPVWYCPQISADCPTVIPQAGSPCDVPNASCGTDCYHEVACVDGVWTWYEGPCPICASPDTPIATPTGERPIADLRVGDLVYSVHERAVIAVPILHVSRTPVRNHRVVRLSLSSGAVLEISPGHPTADGRSFGELVAGDLLDESHAVLATERVPYAHARTYDILPDSTTGTYFAAGALIGSTLQSGR